MSNKSLNINHQPSQPKASQPLPAQTGLAEILNRGVAEVLPSKEGLAKLMDQKKIKVYLGIDPTGSLLTLGHSVVLRKLQQFADAGHEVILLIGNGTVRIGDPTGKDTTRPELTDQVIEENFKDWQRQASKILDFNKIEIRRNGDWLDQLRLPDFIKLMAKTTYQQLIERDMFQDRIKNNLPIFTHELMYPLLQGYDSVAMDVDLEIGGTDQTFNMMMGRHLQKVYNNKEKFVLTTPIINGTDGRKMSKSYGNFIALTENPIDMYGKLMRTADQEIITYFTVLTDVPMDEISQMADQMLDGQNPMEFKKKLALTITTMYHGESEANKAQEHFEKTIQGGEAVEELNITTKLQTISAMAKIVKPDESNSQIRRLIEQGGFQLNDKKMTDPNTVVELKNGDKLKVGKRGLFTVKI